MTRVTVVKKTVRTVVEKDGTRTETTTETTTTGSDGLVDAEAAIKEADALFEKVWKDFDATIAKVQERLNAFFK